MDEIVREVSAWGTCASWWSPKQYGTFLQGSDAAMLERFLLVLALFEPCISSKAVASPVPTIPETPIMVTLRPVVGDGCVLVGRAAFGRMSYLIPSARQGDNDESHGQRYQ